MPETNARARLIEELATLCEDLIYVSETDSRLTPITTEKLISRSPEDYLIALGKTKNRFHEIEFDKFFEDLIVEHDWFDAAERKQARLFRKLKEFFQEHLDEPRVLRVGRNVLDIYVIGTDPEGGLIGVATKAVET